MFPGPDLAVLIGRAQEGDVGAISELYTLYASSILRYMYIRVAERELAQDLTQDVFIRVIKGINSFEYRDEKAFLSWLYTIASNILASHRRRRNLPSTPLDEQAEFADARSLEEVRSVNERLALRQALDQLTDDQQRVLSLRFFADLTNSEIAALLNRTEGAIKALQHRALQSLHRILSRENEEAHTEQVPAVTEEPPPRPAQPAHSAAERLHIQNLHSLELPAQIGD